MFVLENVTLLATLKKGLCAYLPSSFFIDVESSSIMTEENDETDESDRGEKNGKVNEAIKAPDVRKEAT